MFKSSFNVIHSCTPTCTTISVKYYSIGKKKNTGEKLSSILIMGFSLATVAGAMVGITLVGSVEADRVFVVNIVCAVCVILSLVAGAVSRLFCD